MKIILKSKKLYLLLVAITLSSVLLLGVLYTAVPYFAEIIYKAKINKAFDSEFPPMESYLKSMGITIVQTREGVICSNGPFSPSSPCTKYRVSGAITPDIAFIQNWKKKSPALEEYLSLHGWLPDQSTNQKALINIFENDSGNPLQTVIIYSKVANGADCTISINYSLVADNSKKIMAGENCSIYSRFME